MNFLNMYLKVNFCDLKSSNLLVLEKNPWDVRLTDFGSSFQTTVAVQAIPELYFYPKISAPEVKQSKFTTKSDVYSFGYLLWELLTCRKMKPDNPTVEQLLSLLVNKNLVLVSLIKKCWSENPEERPSFKEICIYLSKEKPILLQVDQSQCTFMTTGKEYPIKQPFYGCISCGFTRDKHMGVCENCLKKCHKGHNIVEKYEVICCFCDCGLKEQCCCSMFAYDK